MAVIPLELGLNPTGTLIHTPESVNWHITAVCNYSCRFCFMTLKGFRASLPSTTDLHVSREDASLILRALRDAGTTKLTFAGGEPTLCRALPELVRESSQLGMSTMVVSNGTGITGEFLHAVKGCLAAVKLSIESSSSAVETKLGRGTGSHVETIIEASGRLWRAGVPVMVNSVVTSENWQEDLHDLIGRLRPIRWKVFQALRVQGENEGDWGQLAITPSQFRSFIERHHDLSPVAEGSDLMTGSYVMLDPVGR